MALGAEVRKQRKKRGWTLEELERRSGVSRGTISALEKRDSNKSQYAQALAQAFGLTLSQLLEPERRISNADTSRPSGALHDGEIAFDYGQRLEHAMRLRGISVQMLANQLGLSYQAVRHVVSGQSNAFSAPNHVRACRYLAVSSQWLALGHGAMDSVDQAECTWPFDEVRPQDVATLPQADKEEIIFFIQMKLRRKCS